MSLEDILNHRRSVRHFDSDKPIDPEQVKACLQLATLAPTSSNMQLWECYHITDKSMLEKMVPACLDQLAARSAQQLVVFVTRPDLTKHHAQAALAFERDNIRRNSPAEKHADGSFIIASLFPFGMGVVSAWPDFYARHWCR